MPLVRRILALLESVLSDAPPPNRAATQFDDKGGYKPNDDLENQRGRGRRGGGREGKGVNEYSGRGQRFVGLFHMLNAEKRHSSALRVAMAWGASVIVIGIVFLILCATGTFPASVSDMKAINVYGIYLAKYSLYISGGIMSMAGVILLYNGVCRGGRPTLGLLVTWTAAASILATIALTIYLITKDAELNVQWWSYLIQAVVLVMRIALLLALIAALYAVGEAGRDSEARQAMIEGGY